MSNIIRYKGYSGTVEYSAEGKLFFGEIAFINDTPGIHKKAALVALQRKISLNKLVEVAIEHETKAFN